VTGDQLSLSLEGTRSGLRLPDRISPMQATTVDAAFDDPGFWFEPWWPGTRALAFVEGGTLRLQVAGLSDALAAFPELAELPDQLMDDGAVLDGTLLVLDQAGRPDGGLLRLRLGRGSASRRSAGRPAYVASDLLWSGGASWQRRPFAARRERLASVLADGDRAIAGRGYRREGTLVAEALAMLGIEGLSARRLDARYRAGAAGDAWLRAPVVPAEPRPRPTLALLQRLPLEVG
jgi:bifunctional non-homologous end joining protein LigD